MVKMPINSPSQAAFYAFFLHFGAFRLTFWCILPYILVHFALRFGAFCLAFWCKTPCVLVLNAVRFGANCSAKARVVANIFYGCGCKFGSIFLQREMQKHSKWQKVEGRSTLSWPPFSSFCCILYRFCKVFSSRMVRQKVAICKICLPPYSQKTNVFFRILRLPLSLYYENKAIHG